MQINMVHKKQPMVVDLIDVIHFQNITYNNQRKEQISQSANLSRLIRLILQLQSLKNELYPTGKPKTPED